MSVFKINVRIACMIKDYDTGLCKGFVYNLMIDVHVSNSILTVYYKKETVAKSIVQLTKMLR